MRSEISIRGMLFDFSKMAGLIRAPLKSYISVLIYWSAVADFDPFVNEPFELSMKEPSGTISINSAELVGFGYTVMA